MFFNMRLAARVAALLATSLPAAPVPVFAQLDPQAQSDPIFTLVADHPLHFSEADLRPTNQAFGPLSIDTQPVYGDLSPGAESKSWIYTPDAGFFGRDGFTYRIGGRTLRAWLHVQPAIFPLADRWPTVSCAANGPGEVACPPSTEPGHGAELGWWDAGQGTFNLCDWQSPEVKYCVELGVPGSSGFQTWRPMVLDRDSDGWHELALRDPMSG